MELELDESERDREKKEGRASDLQQVGRQTRCLFESIQSINTSTSVELICMSVDKWIAVRSERASE